MSGASVVTCKPDGTIEVLKTSPVTGKANTMKINCTLDEMTAWRNGKLIQDAMPSASAEEREFLISGCTPEDWKKLYGTGEEA